MISCSHNQNQSVKESPFLAILFYLTLTNKQINLCASVGPFLPTRRDDFSQFLIDCFMSDVLVLTEHLWSLLKASKQVVCCQYFGENFAPKTHQPESSQRSLWVWTRSLPTPIHSFFWGGAMLEFGSIGSLCEETAPHSSTVYHSTFWRQYVLARQSITLNSTSLSQTLHCSHCSLPHRSNWTRNSAQFSSFQMYKIRT